MITVIIIVSMMVGVVIGIWVVSMCLSASDPQCPECKKLRGVIEAQNYALDERMKIINQLREEGFKLMPEICIKSAIRDTEGRIWEGHRHCDAIASCIKGGGDIPLYGGQWEGFVTSTGRFVTREEGYQLQIDAKIPSASGEYRGKRLYSEDLY